MKVGSGNSYRGHLLIANFDARFVVVRVQSGANHQAIHGRGTGNQVDDGLPTRQWVAAQVLGDEAEQAMLDLIPLAGARREMTHAQFQPHCVGQLLQGYLPKSGSTTVAATAVGGDEQFSGPRETRTAHAFPPTPNGS